MTYHVYIGWDDRTQPAYQVAAHSLQRHAKVPVKIHALKSRELKRIGLYRREHKEDFSGQYVDLTDGKPFSTQFTFTRFLVPELWRNLPGEKSPLVLFCDSDFLFLEDIGKMFEEVERQKRVSDGRFPVYCVQHEYDPKSSQKMDGMAQTKYGKKLWSSFVVFDMAHPDNKLLTPEVVNSAAGRELHNFYWITDEHSIGVIPERWNYIPNHSEKNTRDMSAVHHTEGSPSFAEYRNCRYASLWFDEFSRVMHSFTTGVNYDLNRVLFGD